MTIKVLLIKTSSLGDVMHTLPAVTEACFHHPTMEIDWVVEETFQEIPRWHINVAQVHTVSLRRWRHSFWRPEVLRDIRQRIKRFSQKRYDYIIDAQGLLKSALLAKRAKGRIHGLDKFSIREPVASYFYHHRYGVARNQHAIVRLQKLFGQIFNYTPDFQYINAGIRYKWRHASLKTNKVVFLHGTTWTTKHWPDKYWYTLAAWLVQSGFDILLPWGNEREKQRAERISQVSHNVSVLPQMNLAQLAELFSNVSMVISVDTGLSHLAAACDTPVLGLYGASSSYLTGARGLYQHHVSASIGCSPCFKKECQISDDKFPPCLQELNPVMIYHSVHQFYTYLSMHQ